MPDEATEPPKRCRGRPPVRSGDALKTIILGAANAAFLEFGYKATSMENVARRAKVSKGTIYRFWETKPALFAALQIDRRDRFFRGIDEAALATAPLPHGMIVLLETFAEIALSPENIRINRLIIAESAQFPEIAESYYQEGWSQAAAIMTRLLNAYMTQGAIRLDNPKIAAAMLLSMVTGELQRAAVLGLAVETVTREALRDRVSMAVTLFLQGCAISA